MQRRKFGREFKIEAVRLIKQRGVSVAQRPAIWMSTRSRGRLPPEGNRNFRVKPSTSGVERNRAVAIGDFEMPVTDTGLRRRD